MVRQKGRGTRPLYEERRVESKRERERERGKTGRGQKRDRKRY